MKARRSRPATGQPRPLKPHQQRQVFLWIDGYDPPHHGLDARLWARAAVTALIEQKFGIRLVLTAVEGLLAKLEQTPLQRAFQRDPQVIERWRRERFPASARSSSKPKVRRVSVAFPSCQIVQQSPLMDCDYDLAIAE